MLREPYALPPPLAPQLDAVGRARSGGSGGMAGVANEEREQARVPSYVTMHMICYVTICLNYYVIVYMFHYLTFLNQILNQILSDTGPLNS